MSDKSEKYINMAPRWYRSSSPKFFFWGKRLELLLGLTKKLHRDQEIRRHFGISKDVYDSYTDWEMRAYEHGSNWTLKDGRMQIVSLKEVRSHYLEGVIAEIQKSVTKFDRPVRVLEIGCGNGTNLKVLKSHFGNQIDLKGIDISAERIRRGQEYWGEALNDVEMQVDSATSLDTQGDDSFDLLFTVHCLEQIPYSVDQCLAAIERVTKEKVVFVEPVWEFANPTQRIYTLLADQLRTLVPSLASTNLKVLSQTKASILANPLNQTGTIVAEKQVR